MEKNGHFALLKEYLLKQRGTDFEINLKLFFYINFAKKSIFGTLLIEADLKL